MNTYALLSGEVVEYPNQPAVVNAFLARVTAAVNDPNVTPAAVLALAYGVENPLLDTTSVPGRAIVTKGVFENPVYRVLSDLVGRKQMLAVGQTPEQAVAAYTVSVKEAAKQLALTESSVRTAITNRKLSAVKRNGDWYIRPESIASYKVSNRGRKKATPAAATRATEQPGTLVTVRGGSEDGRAVFVRLAGAELVERQKEGNVFTAHFPTTWSRAAVKTTTKTAGGSVRVFEIEPAPGASETIRHGELSVTGPFKITKKHNSTKAANDVWKQYAEQAAKA